MTSTEESEISTYLNASFLFVQFNFNVNLGESVGMALEFASLAMVITPLVFLSPVSELPPQEEWLQVVAPLLSNPSRRAKRSPSSSCNTETTFQNRTSLARLSRRMRSFLGAFSLSSVSFQLSFSN